MRWEYKDRNVGAIESSFYIMDIQTEGSKKILLALYHLLKIPQLKIIWQ